MVCSICKEAGHTAPRCEGVFVTEKTLFLKKYWLPSGDTTEAYDERVKTWARYPTTTSKKSPPFTSFFVYVEAHKRLINLATSRAGTSTTRSYVISRTIGLHYSRIFHLYTATLTPHASPTSCAHRWTDKTRLGANSRCSQT